MAQLPEFEKGLLKFLHKRVAEESGNTARSVGGKVGTLKREALESYDLNEKYETLLSESPTLRCCNYEKYSP